MLKLSKRATKPIKQSVPIKPVKRLAKKPRTVGKSQMARGKTTKPAAHRRRPNRKAPRKSSMTAKKSRGNNETMTLEQMFNETPFSENPPTMIDRRPGSSASHSKSPMIKKMRIVKKSSPAVKKARVSKKQIAADN